MNTGRSMSSPIIVKSPFTLADTTRANEDAARFLADSLGTVSTAKPSAAKDAGKDAPKAA